MRCERKQVEESQITTKKRERLFFFLSNYFVLTVTSLDCHIVCPPSCLLAHQLSFMKGSLRKAPQVNFSDYAVLTFCALLLGYTSRDDGPREVDLKLTEGSARAGHAHQSLPVGEAQNSSTIPATANVCAGKICSSHIPCCPLKESRHLCLKNACS